MSMVVMILVMALVTYLSRFAGLALGSLRVPPFWQRFLHFVPIAVFAALVVPDLPGTRGEWPIRLIAAGLAGIATWRFKALWVGILVGMLAFWALRWI